MKKEDIKEFFRKEKEQKPEYEMKNIENKPTEAGVYTLSIENVKSIVPLTATFDGEDWVNMKTSLSFAGGDASKISYYQEKKPSKKLKM